jgi:hypothetical protein
MLVILAVMNLYTAQEGNDLLWSLSFRLKAEGESQN